MRNVGHQRFFRPCDARNSVKEAAAFTAQVLGRTSSYDCEASNQDSDDSVGKDRLRVKSDLKMCRRSSIALSDPDSDDSPGILRDFMQTISDNADLNQKITLCKASASAAASCKVLRCSKMC